ncbi:thiosulfate:glutathione sulfurtransferase [Cololabis saira]|uniref:thiosulfate:glutathione sulfurtransferase n=1 Tax=Cololabis saira TaxID=129043 RepID=UPI002AD21BF5|nr:thiosulfate:glutathione sulfurtransferase [Cololabis saira]
MVPAPRSLRRAPLLLMMLSSVLSRGFCQVVTEANLKSYPTFASFIRTFTASTPTSGAEDAASVVTHAQLKTMLSNRDIQLFDVRTPEEYQAGRIPQAVNIPLDTLEESLKLSPDDFEQKFQTKAPGKSDDNIVFHCKSGNRSSKALSIARQLGFYRARHYKGGYTEWVEQEEK